MLLYLLHPHHPLRVGAPAASVPRVGTRDHELVKWNTVEGRLDAVLVRLALRHGHAREDGIVVHHAYVTLRDGFTRWGPDHPGDPDDPDDPGDPGAVGDPGDPAVSEGALVPPAELGESYRDRVRRFDAQVQRDRVSMHKLARRRLDDALAAPPVRALVTHWQHLGGQVPPVGRCGGRFAMAACGQPRRMGTQPDEGPSTDPTGEATGDPGDLAGVAGVAGPDTVVEQAAESLVDRYGLTPGQATAFLHGKAGESDADIADVAAEVLEGPAES